MTQTPVTDVVLVPGFGDAQALAAAAVAALVQAGAVEHLWRAGGVGLPHGCVAVGIPGESLVRAAVEGARVLAVLADGVTGPQHVLSVCGAFVHQGASPDAVLRVAGQVGVPSVRVLAAALSALAGEARTGTAPAA